jgi:hypothetical protein
MTTGGLCIGGAQPGGGACLVAGFMCRCSMMAHAPVERECSPNKEGKG